MEVRPANILKKHSRTADKEWSSSLGVGEVLTTPHRSRLNFTLLLLWYDLNNERET